MRLIDADALLEKCNKDQTSLKFAVLNLILHYAPTIDAEPVVRCNECRCRETDECPMHWEEWNVGEDGLDWINVHDYTKDDGFCDWGERREP